MACLKVVTAMKDEEKSKANKGRMRLQIVGCTLQH